MNTETNIKSLLKILEDPNIRFPEYPAFPKDIIIYRMPAGLGVQFRGGLSNIYLRGHAIEAVFELLQNKLNGAHRLDEILQDCENPEIKRDLLQALYQMYSKGLLIDGKKNTIITPNGKHDGVLLRQKLFWGRKLGITQYNSSSEQVQEKIKYARVGVISSGLLGSILTDIFERAGFENLMTYQEDTFDSDDVYRWLNEHILSLDLLLVVARNTSSIFFQEINHLCIQNRTNWLHAHENGVTLDVGPYIIPYDSACYTCMQIRERASQQFPIEEQLYQEHLQNQEESVASIIGESIVSATYGASFIAMEVIRIITGLSHITTNNAVFNIDLVNSNIGKERILRVPRCPDCSKQ